jgi:hypothetical protein
MDTSHRSIIVGGSIHVSKPETIRHGRRNRSFPPNLSALERPYWLKVVDLQWYDLAK